MSQLHVVHYNSDKYSSFHEAKEKQDGLAVLAFFYEVSLAVTIFFNAFVLFNDSFYYYYCGAVLPSNGSKGKQIIFKGKRKRKMKYEHYCICESSWKRTGLHQMTLHCLKHIARVKIDICILWTKWVNWSDRCVVAYCLTFSSHKTVCRSQAPSAI